MHRISDFIYQQAGSRRIGPKQWCRFYQTTRLLKEETSSNVEIKPTQNALAARDYNTRRAAYNRQVSLLRREYAEMIAKQRAADKAEQEALERELTRRRLERQRLKNLRSARNARKEKDLREQREREFQEHLRAQQAIRDSKHDRFTRARQLVIDELEEESPLWLVTHEDVEKAFTHEAEQLLWARPGGVLGAKNPSLDSHFWQFETHTWQMNRSYKSKREVLLEELEQKAYDDANIDKLFWTAERLEEQQNLEDKAKLRAMVHSAGRTLLLRKQMQMIEELHEESDVPKPMPAPSLKMLTNDRALEEEGVKLLLRDPTKFFVFENDTQDTLSIVGDDSSGNIEYVGPTLGSPIALRDPLRRGSPHGTVYPVGIGKYPKPDTRTEREKKQEERQERMLAAAAAEERDTDLDITLAAERQSGEDLEPDLDYNEHEWDSDDEEWNKGLDAELDQDILNTPPEKRYSEEDIDWTLAKLEVKLENLEQQLNGEMETIKQQARSEFRANMSDEESSKIELNDSSLEEALLSLSEKELLALSDLDDRFSEKELSDDELLEAQKEIPSLSLEQIKFVLNRDRSEQA